MVTFSCLSCQKKLSIQEQYAGKKIKCPGCGQVSVAPPPVSAPPDQTAEFDSTKPVARGAELKPPVKRNTKTLGPDASLVRFLAPAQAPDELGRLGKYRILAIIGAGGMGVVYKAEDSVLKRMVAVKAILPTLGASANDRKRFLREARTMAALEHENIVRLYEVGEDRDVPYIAMEMLTGESLEARLKSHPEAMPLPEVLRIGRELAAGLAAAHTLGMMHRDIKPANIFLTANGARVKILDFGLARAVEEDSRITQSGAVLGTPAYMAPEQSRGEKIDYRCDLFSLGVVLYRLSTGRDPFKRADAISTLGAIATETPPTPQVQNFAVPSDLSDLIMILLAKDPDERGGSAQAAVDALRCIERGEPTGLPKPASAAPDESDANEWHVVTSSAAKPKPQTGKFPLAIIVLAAVAAVAVCVLVPLVAAAFLFLR